VRAEPATSAERLLTRCHFPPAGTPVSLAVSGGPDSLALLVLARAAGLEAVAVHVDHGLREGSAAEAAIVAEAAERFGAGFEARAVAVEAGPDLEARARRARYGALPSGVMTGHTMDDQAETVLINLLRGAGLDGLAGIRAEAPGRPRRPLLRLRRSETAGLCEAVGLAPLDDPTNRDPSFVRNRVRAEVLPLLCEVSGRDVVPVLARQAALLADEAALLDELAAGLDATDARSLQDLPAPLARRAVRRWLRAADGASPERHPPSAAEVARVLAVAAGAAQACEIAGGRRVARTAGRLRVENPFGRATGNAP
jgi:tRNA(Ile)-lysidine synthase